MRTFSSMNLLSNKALRSLILALITVLCLPFSGLAQTDPLGCVVDAGIDPQEVCRLDHIQLGGSPTVNETLSAELQSLEWTVLSGSNVEFMSSTSDENPMVQIEETSVFQVTLTLTDGSVCLDSITLVPIVEPTLDLQGSWVQCNGSTSLTFYNTSPSNSVDITYDVAWGDGQTTEDLPFASAFEHTYEAEGAYSVEVSASLGSCVNEETVDVFLGTPAGEVELVVPEEICSGAELAFDWNGLSEYPLGSSWQILIDGLPAFSGLVDDETEGSFTWSFGPADNCLDAIASHTVYAEVVNACLPPASGQANVQVSLAPQADFMLGADSCSVVQFSLGAGTPCGDLFDVAWNITDSNGEGVVPATISGAPNGLYWQAQMDTGVYQATLTVQNEGCGMSMDTANFCIEMSSPSDWNAPSLSNGGEVAICVGDSVDLGIGELVSICGAELSTTWTLSDLTPASDLGSVTVLEASDWSRRLKFDEPGLFLVELDGTLGCGDLHLFATVVVAELPVLEVQGFNNGVVDTVVCEGEDVTVVASLNGDGIENGAYDLMWTLLNDDGDMHPSASQTLFGDSSIVVNAPEAGNIWVALEVSSPCGAIHDTLQIVVEGPMVPEYTLLQGTEGIPNNGVPEFLGCFGDSLMLGFNVPWASEVDVYSSTTDLWNISFEEADNMGSLHWLANGEDWEFEIEYTSYEGCITTDQLSFRTVLPPTAFVPNAQVVCQGELSSFEAIVGPGSSNTYDNFTWWVDGIAAEDSGNAVFETVLPCGSEALVSLQVTDDLGCSVQSPLATGPVSCPTANVQEFYGCSGMGDTLCSPFGMDAVPDGWELPSAMWLSTDSNAACVVVDTLPQQFDISYISLTGLGCPRSNQICWSVGLEGENGECNALPCSAPPSGCDAVVSCMDPEACNYMLASCCIDSCLYAADFAAANSGMDTLVHCQSYTPVDLAAVEPWIGEWSGPGVSNQTPGCPGTTAHLNISNPGEWDIVFTGGLGACRTMDTVHVIVHALPQYTPEGAIYACHQEVVDLSLGAQGAGDLCWNIAWLGSESTCAQDTLWTMNGSGNVSWSVTDANGCSNQTIFQVIDWGVPNAYAGEDKIFCNQPYPEAMEFQFGEPYALGCDETIGTWDGEGASFEFFAEVWQDGNCIAPSEPWTDSLWVFTPSELGDFEWVWSVVDCHGCQASDTVNISVVEPVAPLVPDLTFCLNDPVGLVTDQPGACWFGPGISPDYVFDPQVAGEGTFEWTVGVGEGSCAMTDTVEVSIHPNPVVDLNGFGPWPCQGEAYSMCVEEPSEGAFPWNIDWSSYPSVEEVDTCTTFCLELTNADALNVTTLVTDVNGCQAEDNFPISLAPSPEVILPDSAIYCLDLGYHILEGSTPLGGQWEGTNVTPNGVFFAGQTGTFTMHYSFVNASNCIDTDSMVVEVTPVPAPSIATPPTNVCLGTPFSLLSADEGVWSGTGIDQSGSIYQSQAGVYTYMLTSGVGSCLAQDSVDITFIAPPQVALPVDTILCAGTPIDIEFSEQMIAEQGIVSGLGFGCEGLTGQFPSFTFAPTSTCDFTLMVENEHGCFGFDAMTVIVPLPVPSYPGPPEVYCMGDSDVLDGQIVPSCATELTWTGDLMMDDGVLNADTVGLHWVTLEYFDCFGCPVESQREILVLDLPSIELTLEDSVVCAGQELGVNVAGYGGNLSFAWEWANEEGAFPAPDTPWVAVNEGSSPSLVDVSVVGTNLCGSSSDQASVVVNPTFNINPSSFPDTLVCTPIDIAFEANGVPGAEVWIWSNALTENPDNPSSASLVLDDLEEITVFDLSVQAGLLGSLCSNPTTWQVTVIPGPAGELEANVNQYCGEQMQPGVEFSAENGTYEWFWSGGDLPETFPEFWSINEYGITQLDLVVTTDHPVATCASTLSMDIELQAQPVAQFELVSDSAVCAPGLFSLLDLSIDAQNVAWHVDHVGGLILPGTTADIILTDSGSYGLSWVAQGLGGCRDSIYVPDVLEILPSPYAGIWANQPAQLPWSFDGNEFVFNDISVGSDSTTWTIGDSTIVDEAILNFFYQDPGIYALNQHVLNTYGCQDTMSYRFEIIDELAIHVPTAFTPNRDNINDVWIPVIAGSSRIDQYHLQVVSRAGQVLFDTTQPSEGWDASNSRREDRLEDVQNATFTYMLEVLPFGSPLEGPPEWIRRSGIVTIVD